MNRCQVAMVDAHKNSSHRGTRADRETIVFKAWGVLLLAYSQSACHFNIVRDEGLKKALETLAVGDTQYYDKEININFSKCLVTSQPLSEDRSKSGGSDKDRKDQVLWIFVRRKYIWHCV